MNTTGAPRPNIQSFGVPPNNNKLNNDNTTRIPQLTHSDDIVPPVPPVRDRVRCCWFAKSFERPVALNFHHWWNGVAIESLLSRDRHHHHHSTRTIDFPCWKTKEKVSCALEVLMREPHHCKIQKLSFWRDFLSRVRDER